MVPVTLILPATAMSLDDAVLQFFLSKNGCIAHGDIHQACDMLDAASVVCGSSVCPSEASHLQRIAQIKGELDLGTACRVLCVDLSSLNRMSQKKLKRLYNKLALEVHPDKVSADERELATDIFRRLRTSLHILQRVVPD